MGCNGQGRGALWRRWALSPILKEKTWMAASLQRHLFNISNHSEWWNAIKINYNWEMDAEWRQRSPSASWAILAINLKITGLNIHYWIQMPPVSFTRMQRHQDTGLCLTVTVGWKIKPDISQAWFHTEKLSPLCQQLWKSQSKVTLYIYCLKHIQM